MVFLINLLVELVRNTGILSSGDQKVLKCLISCSLLTKCNFACLNYDVTANLLVVNISRTSR